MTEYEPADVLENYVRQLCASQNAVIRDASDLPYPKDVIKSVLRGCIRGKNDPETKRCLMSAYIFLASFQDLTKEEREAVALIGDIGAPGSEISPERVRVITTFGAPYAEVLLRFKTEVEQLDRELREGR
jgi:hypothetical protein